MPWGHTAAHTSQEVPWALSRHFALSMAGTKVRFALPTRLMSALMGQNVLHHLRKNTTSASKSAGTRMTPQATSPKANRRMTSTMVAKVRPMGQMRQNTGKPKTAGREQGAAQDDVAGIESRPLLGAGRAAVAATGEGRLLVGGKGRGGVGGKGCCVCRVCVVRRVRHAIGFRSLRGFHQGVILGGKTPVPVMSVFDVFFEKMPRIFDTTGTGHTQPQKARANSRMRASAMTTEMTARGSRVFVAIIVASRAQGAQKRDVLPADGRQRAHAHMGGKAHADDADDGEGNDGAESLGIHEGTSFTTRGDGR